MNLETLKTANDLQSDIAKLKNINIQGLNLTPKTKKELDKEINILIVELQRQFNKL